MRLEDAQLVAQCLDGQIDAYGELVRRYQGSVYATAYYYVGRYGAAEDIAQDAFLAAYKNLPKLNNPASFGPWLKEIACRTAANWLRKHSKQLEVETPLPHKRTVSIEDVRLGPRGRLERKERLAFVQKAIDSLPERYRLPVVLRYMQELSYDEIARYTGQTRDEVRGVLQRAGRQLRDILSSGDEISRGDEEWHRARE